MKPVAKPINPLKDDFTFDRRELFTDFLAEHGAKIALSTLGVTGLAAWGYQSYRERKLKRELVQGAMPILTRKTLNEQQYVPAQGKSEIKRYFDGVCLNVHRFVNQICSEPFLEQLWACQTDDEQHNTLFVAFHRSLVGDTQILTRVEAIASNLGSQVDQQWFTSCTEMAESWTIYIGDKQDHITGKALLDSMEPVVVAELQKAQTAALGVDKRAAIEQIENAEIGKSAILLLEIQRVTETLFLPAFCVAAMHHEFEDVVKLLKDQSPHFQFEISQQIASLGNRIGADFESELLTRIKDLHKWQKDALEVAAATQAHKAISWFA